MLSMPETSAIKEGKRKYLHDAINVSVIRRVTKNPFCFPFLVGIQQYIGIKSDASVISLIQWS